MWYFSLRTQILSDSNNTSTHLAVVRGNIYCIVDEHGGKCRYFGKHVLEKPNGTLLIKFLLQVCLLDLENIRVLSEWNYSINNTPKKNTYYNHDFKF